MTTDADHVVAVSDANCQHVVGAPWKWVLRFAAAHDVPVVRWGRRVVVPAQALTAALERAASTQPPADALAAEVARMKAEIADETCAWIGAVE